MAIPIQICAGGSACNLTPFGRSLRRFLLTKTDLLPSGTWMSGGCWTLAAALQTWSNGALSLYTVWGRGIPQHVVAGGRFSDGRLLGDGRLLCLDGDGLAWDTELLTKMRWIEGVNNPTLMPFDQAALESVGIECYPLAVATLIRSLRTTFGEWSWDQVLADFPLRQTACAKIVTAPRGLKPPKAKNPKGPHP